MVLLKECRYELQRDADSLSSEYTHLEKIIRLSQRLILCAAYKYSHCLFCQITCYLISGIKST